jgi:hypothetical protein
MVLMANDRMLPEVAFVAGPPVSGDRFFGRKQLLKSLEQFTASATSVLLLGERRIGKSSVLIQFRLTKAELDDVRIRRIVVGMTGIVVRGGNSDFLIPRITQQLLSSPELQMSDTEPILDRIRGHESDIVELLSCLARLRDKGCQLVLLFDDINDSVRAGDSDQMGFVLRSIATEGHLAIIATSFVGTGELHAQSQLGSPWANFFRVQHVGLFDHQEAEELLIQLSSKSGRALTAAERTFLLNVFGRYPYELQIAGSNLFRGLFATTPKRKRASCLIAAAESSMYELYSFWSDRLLYRPEQEVEALIRVAHKRPVSDAHMVQELLDRGLIVDGTSGLETYSCAFGEFLRQVNQQGAANKSSSSGAVWSGVRSLLAPALEASIKKIAEIAAEKFLHS